LAAVVDGGDMSVAVADEAVQAAVNRLAEAPAIIAVQERDADTVQRNVSELAVAGFARRFDCVGELRPVLITIAENEVSRPVREKLNDFGGTDVAAMKHGLDFEAFEKAQRRTGKRDVTVCVADDTESHRD
jgi:hypothetical protein